MEGGYLSTAKKSSSNEQSILKVTLKQALAIADCQDEHYQLDGHPVDKMMINARIVQMGQKKHKVELLMDDDTAQLELGYFLNENLTVADLLDQIKYTPNCYISAVVFIKVFRSKVQFLCNSLHPGGIENVVAHNLDVITQHYHRKHETGYLQGETLKKTGEQLPSLSNAAEDILSSSKDPETKLFEIVCLARKHSLTPLTKTALFALVQRHMNKHEYNVNLQGAEDFGYLTLSGESVLPV